MHDLLGPGTTLGYCTNVHAGSTLEQTCANLDRHAVAVKQLTSPDAPMGIGLWLSAGAARDLVDHDRIEPLRAFLDERGLLAFTLNGFPYGDFHRERVKHDVYHPDWTDQSRATYTMELADILAVLLDEGDEGSISTLPLGWGESWKPAHDERAAALIARVVAHLERVEGESGRLVHLDIEPEPGCTVQRSEDLVRFFREHVVPRVGDDRAARYLRVCHDICHAAVMDDAHADALRRYDEAGLRIGKVQISSALDVELAGLEPTDRAARLEELRPFCEGRYLHQTTARSGAERRLFDDLPAALEAAAADRAIEGLRVHFHVPIDLESIGTMGTTRRWISEGVPLLRDAGVRHFEVETYAWDVLPTSLRVAKLAAGIARELDWVAQQCTVIGGADQ